jgi:hypothetical protein
MTTFRRVPYTPDPNAAPYHEAHAYAVTREGPCQVRVVVRRQLRRPDDGARCLDERARLREGNDVTARLLIVHHTPSPHCQEMFEAVVAGATDPDIEGVEVVRRPALTVSAMKHYLGEYPLSKQSAS